MKNMAVRPYLNRSEVWLASGNFRVAFKFPLDFHPSAFIKWYPGHMAKGLRIMEAKMAKCDCVLEVHDARLPYSGRNEKFVKNFGGRPHILVLNKADLGEGARRGSISKSLERKGIRPVFLNSKDVKQKPIKKIVQQVLDSIQIAEYEGVFRRRNPDQAYHLLVCGLPNVGKSSLINAIRRTYLRKGKATRVGGDPGMTRSVMQKIQICDEPKMYALDSPGITSHQIDTFETGMKLALIGCFPDHMIGQHVIADYLLFTLNKYNQFSYVDLYDLPDPCDDVDIVLRYIACKMKYRTGGGLPDYNAAAVNFISMYRKGKLGTFYLDP
ncbi:mitochondrial ribosome-associated GTPase 1-like isoform X1 [Dendronephthya gigantea]|uniref:mitochondrial ribosome-associated GTPase 1-like isoform X1 n=2 Tax=Dendronephthya gigantea TaxID=151771 RepID=UPI00106C4FCE|nr:mitochondrial ribosome-associated GTPase 1-like isoform X1 [Dendronephthya gigantea]